MPGAKRRTTAEIIRDFKERHRILDGLRGKITEKETGRRWNELKRDLIDEILPNKELAGILTSEALRGAEIHAQVAECLVRQKGGKEKALKYIANLEKFIEKKQAEILAHYKGRGEGISAARNNIRTVIASLQSYLYFARQSIEKEH